MFLNWTFFHRFLSRHILVCTELSKLVVRRSPNPPWQPAWVIPVAAWKSRCFLFSVKQSHSSLQKAENSWKRQSCWISGAEKNLVEGERSSILGSPGCADEICLGKKLEFRCVPPPLKCVGRKKTTPTGQGRVRNLWHWRFLPWPELNPYFFPLDSGQSCWVPSTPLIGKVKNFYPQQIQV